MKTQVQNDSSGTDRLFCHHKNIKIGMLDFCSFVDSLRMERRWRNVAVDTHHELYFVIFISFYGVYLLVNILNMRECML
jgi:hypothetical protein